MVFSHRKRGRRFQKTTPQFCHFYDPVRFNLFANIACDQSLTQQSRPVSVSAVFAGLVPQNHPDINMLLADPNTVPLPGWHPSLESIVTRINWGTNVTVSVPVGHANIDAAYVAAKLLPASHPDVAKLFAATPPPTHPDLDRLLANPASNPLPAFHPTIENYITHYNTNSIVTNVSAWHADPDVAYAAGKSIGSWHPSVDALFRNHKPALLPTGHPNLDTLLGDPSSHPCVPHLLGLRDAGIVQST